MDKQKFDGYADQYDGWFVANKLLFKSEFQLVKTAIEERLINSGAYDLATAYQSVHVNY